jgi:hypothetical protein
MRKNNKKRDKKAKEKIMFTLCCVLYFVSFILFGIVIGTPVITVILMCAFSIVAIWQLEIDEEKTNKYALIMLGVNVFLSCMSMSIRAFVLGDSDAGIIAITVIVTLLIIVGLPILVVFCIAKKNNVGFNEPLVQPKNYTPEEQEHEKKKSYAVAKRTVVMSNLASISLNQTLLSLVLFVAGSAGISAIAHIADKQMLSFMMSGGCFLVICCVCLIIFAVTGIWAAIGYKRLEIMCVHMGSELEGSREVDEQAMRANLAQQMGKITGVPTMQGIGVLGSIQEVIYAYLYMNGQKIYPYKLFKILSKVLVVAQIGMVIYFVAKMYFS